MSPCAEAVLREGAAGENKRKEPARAAVPPLRALRPPAANSQDTVTVPVEVPVPAPEMSTSPRRDRPTDRSSSRPGGRAVQGHPSLTPVRPRVDPGLTPG